MDVIAPVAVIALLAIVVWIVSGPLRAGAQAVDAQALVRRDDLEAAKEAKYRELREADLDRRTGKLAEDDFRRIDRQLRAEAVAILRELDALDV
jgi:hypothetical protein